MLPTAGDDEADEQRRGTHSGWTGGVARHQKNLLVDRST
jgi:hypothetical protein